MNICPITVFSKLVGVCVLSFGLMGAAGCGKSAADSGPAGAGGVTHPAKPDGSSPKTAAGADAYQGPVAFSVMAEGLSASFTDHSSGSVEGQQWVFGDGATSTAASPVHAYSQQGKYEVTETITQGGGRTSSRTMPVRVMALPPELHNGVARADLSAVNSYELDFFARVPTGATRLEFEVTGGVGDLELFVRHGSVPTEEVYDCHRPQDGHVVICSFDLPDSGPYYAALVARKTFAAASVKASWREAQVAR